MRNIDCKRILHAIYAWSALPFRLFSHAGLLISGYRKYIKITA